MLDFGKASNNAMAGSASNAQSASSTAPKSGTARVTGSNGGVISEYYSGWNSKSNSAVSPAASNSNVQSQKSSAVSPATSNSSMQGQKNSAVSPAVSNSSIQGQTNSAVSPAASNSNMQGQTNSAVSPAASNSSMPGQTNSAVSPAVSGMKSTDFVSGQGCTKNRARFPDATPYAMAYVPFQQLETTYPAERGLEYGTIFPELNKPFLGGGMKK